MDDLTNGKYSNLVRICAVSGIISRSGPKENFFLIALQKLNRVHISASSKQRLLLEVEYPSRKESYPSPDNPSRFP